MVTIVENAIFIFVKIKYALELLADAVPLDRERVI